MQDAMIVVLISAADQVRRAVPSSRRKEWLLGRGNNREAERGRTYG